MEIFTREVHINVVYDSVNAREITEINWMPAQNIAVFCTKISTRISIETIAQISSLAFGCAHTHRSETIRHLFRWKRLDFMRVRLVIRISNKK